MEVCDRVLGFSKDRSTESLNDVWLVALTRCGDRHACFGGFTKMIGN